MGIRWEKDSYDGGDHLNLYGAQKVSTFVGDYLSENYDLPSRKKDKAYKAWNKQAKKYKKKVKEKIAEMKAMDAGKSSGK